jgi:hypothetical protein
MVLPAESTVTQTFQTRAVRKRRHFITWPLRARYVRDPCRSVQLQRARGRTTRWVTIRRYLMPLGGNEWR